MNALIGARGGSCALRAAMSAAMGFGDDGLHAARPAIVDPSSAWAALILLRHKFLRKFRVKLRAHAGHRGSRAWPIA